MEQIHYVDTESELLALCRVFAEQPWIALDTEFVREETYFPRLCLLQLAVPGTVACVDPLVLSLDPLLDVIYDRAITKVFHACHQDLETLFHLHGALPTPLFDTQIAAPLLGLPAQASYARLVEDVLGTHLEKAHTRTDWSRRPLSTEQLDYAADDARYLGPLYLHLRDRLSELGRLQWLEEDFTAACDPARYNGATPQDAWRRIRGTQHLSGRQLAILQALAAWREATARRADRPRGWILRDEIMIELACTAPSSKAGLDALHVSGKTIARHGDDLLAAIASGSGAPELTPARGAKPSPLTSTEEALFERMSSLVQEQSKHYGIDAAVLASRNDLVDLIRKEGNASLRLLTGWKRHAIGEQLLQLKS
ncbi:MAG: ribonuclease D [Chromatiales bacterium]|jgi:ribonuclease D|nr:ribonuclease D [Chromatiales bacterium]